MKNVRLLELPQNSAVTIPEIVTVSPSLGESPEASLVSWMSLIVVTCATTAKGNRMDTVNQGIDHFALVIVCPPLFVT